MNTSEKQVVVQSSDLEAIFGPVYKDVNEVRRLTLNAIKVMKKTAKKEARLGNLSEAGDLRNNAEIFRQKTNTILVLCGKEIIK